MLEVSVQCYKFRMNLLGLVLEWDNIGKLYYGEIYFVVFCLIFKFYFGKMGFFVLQFLYLMYLFLFKFQFQYVFIILNFVCLTLVLKWNSQKDQMIVIFQYIIGSFFRFVIYKLMKRNQIRIYKIFLYDQVNIGIDFYFFCFKLNIIFQQID